MHPASVSMRSAAAALGAFGLVVGSVAALAHFRGIPSVPVAAAAAEAAPAAVALTPRAATSAVAQPNGPTPPFADLDLGRADIEAQEVTAPMGARTAHLTLDPNLQKFAHALLKQHRLPEAAIVMMDPDTGAILVWASRIEPSERRRTPRYDFAASAVAPSASVFKIVTAAELVEHDGLGPQTRECIARSAEQRILASDLVDDPLRDKWCMTLATAMGKSENAVFARLAHRRLDPASLGEMARAFGYGQSLAFDLPVQPGELRLPDDPLAFARTAAGFWNTTLSPVHAAYISAIVARGGSAVRPFLVRRVTRGAKVEYEAPPPSPHPVIRKETAQALETMMEHTVSEGTSYRAFHDAHRRSFLPVQAAGKTGTLNDPDRQHLYTWFTGFAPSHGSSKAVVIAVLVVNRPRWHVKANVVAREMLHEYYRQDARAVASAAEPTAVASAER